MGLPDLLKDAERQLTICNSCRYCESYCAVFPALELRTEFAKKDVIHLANLCHDCRGCYFACMYTPPHEFAVNIPAVLAAVRVETYREYGWPRVMSRFLGGGIRSVLVTSIVGVGAALGAVVAFGEPGQLLLAQPPGPGSFFRILPYAAMAVPFLVLSAFVIVVMFGGLVAYWRDTRGRLGDLMDGAALAGAAADAFGLRYLNDTGDGCFYPGEEPAHQRRFHHHLVFYGFLADLASTTIAAYLHNVLDVHPPYPLWSVPVVLGTAGGVAQIIGTVGLLRLKWRSDERPAHAKMVAKDYAFLASLNLVSVTGMLTLMLRETPLLGSILVVHLGTLVAFFLTMPYGKFVHFVYRYAALVQNRIESRPAPTGEPARPA